MTGAVARFQVLGPLRFEREGESVALPGGRPRQLLAVLLSAGGVPLSRDRLIDELWGEQPPPTAVSAVHVHISKLRSVLGDLLVLDSAGYRLNSDAYVIDSEEFDDLVARARAAAGTDNHAARALVATALALGRGEPLADVPAEGGIGRWRQTLEEKHLQAELLRIDLELDAGGAGELITEIEALLANHPYEERAWIQLVRALERAGRPAEALDAYQRVRRLFATELGIEPAEQLTVLQAQILSREQSLPHLGPDATVQSPSRPSAPPSPARESSLPRPPARLIGRDSELAQLMSLIEDPAVRLVTLVGPGGVGKTRLLLELARAQEGLFEDGGVFVPLERLDDSELVLREIAASLSRRPGSEAIGADALLSYLANDELLLVLDNFEHLLDAAGQVADLLSRAPRVRMLVSSRTPLRIRGEEVFEVEPLALPTSVDPASVLASPAVRLFLERSRAANPRALAAGAETAVDAETARLAAAVCTSVDGLPLGIELAAARSGSLGLEAVAAQISSPLGLGENALRDLPDRQRTLTRTIRWSYDLLTAEARSVLQAAGAFIGGFTAVGLAAAAGREDVQGELSELLDASFARRVGGPGNRYELLPLVRLFAAEELAGSGQADDVLRRHSEYFAGLLKPVIAALDAGDALTELAAPLEPDHANIKVALERAIARGDAECAVPLALGMRPLWFVSIRHREAQDLIERTLGTLEVPAGAELLLLRAASFLDGFSGHAYIWTRRLVDRARELGDTEALGIGIGNLFSEAVMRRDREQIRKLRPELEAQVASGAGDRTIAWAHYSLALDAYLEGDFDRSAGHARSSFDHATAVAYDYLAAAAAATGLLASSAGAGAIARDDLLEVLAMAERSSVQKLTMFALWFVARYGAGVGSDTALRWLAQADRIQRAIGSDMWPEVVLREETLRTLEIDDASVMDLQSSNFDESTALSDARAWLESRPAHERAPRPGVARPDDQPRAMTPSPEHVAPQLSTDMED